MQDKIETYKKDKTDSCKTSTLLILIEHTKDILVIITKYSLLQ